MPFAPQPALAWRMYRRLVHTRVEYFSPPKELPKADILKLYCLPAPYPGAQNRSRPTILIDLGQTEDAFWNGVDPKTRKAINQAEREGIKVDRISELSEEDWNVFRAAYRKLQGRKKNTIALGVEQIGELIESNSFALTVSRDKSGTLLSWHTYIRCNGHARLLNSISDIGPDRDSQWNNMVGRAHRLHHWRDMLLFKAEGMTTYDLGGVYRGTEDAEQVGIAKFKKSFGGESADTFDAVLPLTGKGRLASFLVTMLKGN